MGMRPQMGMGGPMGMGGHMGGPPGACFKGLRGRAAGAPGWTAPSAFAARSPCASMSAPRLLPAASAE